MPPRHDTFTFTHRALEGRVVRLGYRLSGGPSPDVDIEETFTLPREAGIPEPTEALDRAIEALHVAAGVSYWKTSCPPLVERREGPLAPADARFFERLWSHGLGEFFFVNGQSPVGRVALPAGPADRPPAAAPPGLLDGPALTLIGGGKDSAVSIELLRAAGRPQSLLCVGRHARIVQAAEASGIPLLVVERSLSPRLFELNAQGALNGHVPISALLQLAAQVVALAMGFGAVVASNERSASAGNVVLDGVEINHQWSKGIDFERSLQAWSARHLVGGPATFSLLRPFSELAIARELARHPRWHGAITSCNANFSLHASGAPRWCGRCPKCVFVFAVTTPWLDDASRALIFGADFLADAANLPLVEELLGLSGHKPFECVGTPDEMIAALWLCHDGRLHAGTPALALFRERVLPGLEDPQRLVEDCLRPSEDHLVPARWQPVLHAALRSR
jgi:UDP-N-acetyl-alpha-D-muramoyl-L-alanyl-L-glutamate epimerase